MKNSDLRKKTQDRLANIEVDRQLALQSKDAVIDAINKTLVCAKGDTGGSMRCAQFMLSLWNGDYYKCDLQELLYVDSNIHQHFMMIMDFLHKTNDQLSTFITKDEIYPVIEMWGNSFSIEK